MLNVIYDIFNTVELKINLRFVFLSEKERASELYELEKITRELIQVTFNLNLVKDEMIKFAYALETNPGEIIFLDREILSEEPSKFVFNYEKIKRLLNIETIEKIILKTKDLLDRKQRLEERLRVKIVV